MKPSLPIWLEDKGTYRSYFPNVTSTASHYWSLLVAFPTKDVVVSQNVNMMLFIDTPLSLRMSLIKNLDAALSNHILQNDLHQKSFCQNHMIAFFHIKYTSFLGIFYCNSSKHLWYLHCCNKYHKTRIFKAMFLFHYSWHKNRQRRVERKTKGQKRKKVTALTIKATTTYFSSLQHFGKCRRN